MLARTSFKRLCHPFRAFSATTWVTRLLSPYILRVYNNTQCRGAINTMVADAAAVATALADANANAKLLQYGPTLNVATLADAYAIQKTLIPVMDKHNFPLVGWKIGATNVMHQQRLGLSQPFYGPLFTRDIKTSPAAVRSASSYRLRGVECEFVFKFGREVKASNGKEISSQDVLDATTDIFPAIEVCASRVSENNNTFLTIADQASHGRLIIAPHLRISPDKWHAFAKTFKENPVKLLINGKEVAVGDGTAVLGNPLTAVAWLANALRDAGYSLQENQLVTSGTMTGLTPAKIGDVVVGDFAGFGKVKLEFHAN